MAAVSWRKKTKPKTVMYVYRLLTIGPQVLTSEPLRLILPLRVRNAESPLGRVQFLQRNEESFHHVSCKPVTMARVRNRKEHRGHG